MSKSLPGSAALARPIEALFPLLSLLLALSFSAGCEDDDDDPVQTYDSGIVGSLDAGAGDSGAKDASAPSDSSVPPDAAATDSTVPPLDSGGSTQPDASPPGMDAASEAGTSSDAAVDAGDAAQDASSDAARDAASDTGTGDASTSDAGTWPPPGCDESYRFVARGNGSNGRYQVAQGDHFVPFVLDAPWNNQEVQAVAFRIVMDNAQIVKRVRLENAASGEVLTQFAAHDPERTILPNNVGVRLPSGMRSLRLTVRYVNQSNGTRSDASGVDVCIVRQTHLRGTLAATTKAFAAPTPIIEANSANVEVTSVCNVNNVQPAYLLSAGPYAHQYAIWTKFTVTKKNGTEIVMHHQAYDFDDRSLFYPLTPEVLIEKGDQVTTTCVFTNPSDEDLPAGSGAETLEGQCQNLALYYPAGVLNCTTPP